MELADEMPDGVSKWWHENGKLAREETYKYGELVSHKEWNRDGKLTYEDGEIISEKTH
jgi:antitoxin component YwqK of YwqJK toxin-antitoxin module